jgi:hypothetical protein
VAFFALRDIELHQDVAHVSLDRALAHEEAPCDGDVGEAFGAEHSAAPIELDPRHVGRRRGSRERLRRAFLWLYLLTALIVAVRVLMQAFSIAAYARGAGTDALDMHRTVGFVTHSVEIVVFLVAFVGCWGTWRQVALALLLPVIGTIQVLLIGDTSASGSWINGLHGLFALVVLLLASALAQEGKRSLSAAPH